MPSFSAFFTGQGELTPQGYAKVKDRAVQMLDAIDAMCRKYPNLIVKATTPAEAYRMKKGLKTHRLRRHGERLPHRRR